MAKTTVNSSRKRAKPTRAAITAVHGYVPPDVLTNAELALPKGKATAAEEEDGEGGSAGSGDAATLAAYMTDPTPGAIKRCENTEVSVFGV